MDFVPEEKTIMYGKITNLVWNDRKCLKTWMFSLKVFKFQLELKNGAKVHRLFFIH